MTITEALQGLWDQLLDLTALFVIPDWSEVIRLLPLLVLLGVVGPFLTLLILGVVVYQVRKPRVKVHFEEWPRTAEIDAGGEPIYPPGLPHCRRDMIVYASGTHRCEVCRQELAVSCPMCSVGRVAALDTCGNCGLVLRIETRTLATRTAGPRPGGAAAA